MNYINAIKDIFMSILNFLFAYDVDNPFYVVSMVVIVASITLGSLFYVMKWKNYK